MLQKETTTKFSFSYGELLQQALEKSTFFRRDQAALANRGVTSQDLDVFDDLITAFEETKDDDILTGLIAFATQKRDTKRAATELAGRDILGIAESVFKENASLNKAAGFVNLSRLSDTDFLMESKKLHEIATVYLPDLQTHGLTQAMLDQFINLINEFRPMVKDLAAAKSDRNKNTLVRRTAANALYDEMARLCLKAVNYFKDRDQSTYTDYVIYSKSSSSQTRSGTLNLNTIVSRSFLGISPETIFKLKSEGTGPIDFYFSTTEGGNPITTLITVPEYQELYHSAAELGYNAQTGAVKFNIRNASQTETSSYFIRIE